MGWNPHSRHLNTAKLGCRSVFEQSWLSFWRNMQHYCSSYTLSSNGGISHQCCISCTIKILLSTENLNSVQCRTQTEGLCRVPHHLFIAACCFNLSAFLLDLPTTDWLTTTATVSPPWSTAGLVAAKLTHQKTFLTTLRMSGHEQHNWLWLRI